MSSEDEEQFFEEMATEEKQMVADRELEEDRMYEENFKASEDLLHAANKKRRKIPRAGGEEHGWWNSTLYSYAFYGDDITCQHNFRMNRATMQLTHNLFVFCWLLAGQHVQES